MGQPKYHLVKQWSDADASYFYYLEASAHYDRKHSCYSCYDDWAFMRRKCHNNQKDWTRVPNAYGGIKWAQKIAKHYKIMLPVEV